MEGKISYNRHPNTRPSHSPHNLELKHRGGNLLESPSIIIHTASVRKFTAKETKRVIMGGEIMMYENWI